VRPEPRGEDDKRGGRTGRPRDEAVQRALIGAATDLLRERGYRALSMEGVAARAGVAKQSVYRRWPSKGALLVDIYMEGMGEESLPAASGHGVIADFRAYLGQTVERLKDVAWANTLRSLVAEAQNDPDLAALMVERVVEPRRQAGRHIVAQAIAAGELSPDFDVETVLDFVFGAIWYRLLLGHAAVTTEFVERMLRQLFPAPVLPRRTKG
jgi:AcrR family transcriptional regulator